VKQPGPQRQYRRLVKRLRGPFTQAEAAKAAGCSVQSIEDWEAGRTRPKKPPLRKLIDHAIEWHKHFGHDPGTLITDAIDLLIGMDDQPDEQKED